MSISTAVEVVIAEETIERREMLAVAGFLAGYGGSTRVSYATDLRLFASWCHEAKLNLFIVRRPHLELYGRWLEETGRMRSTMGGRRFSTLASFYKHAEQEQLVDRDPALNIRRPEVDYESTLGLNRTELGAFLVPSGIGSARDHATSLWPERFGRSPRPSTPTSTIWTSSGAIARSRSCGKGGKRVTIPLAPRTSRALDLYLGRAHPIFLGAKGARMDRHPPPAIRRPPPADRTAKRLARRAGIAKRISPHSLRHSLRTAAR